MLKIRDINSPQNPTYLSTSQPAIIIFRGIENIVDCFVWILAGKHFMQLDEIERDAKRTDA
jgi:hypothetical protein